MRVSFLFCLLFISCNFSKKEPSTKNHQSSDMTEATSNSTYQITIDPRDENTEIDTLVDQEISSDTTDLEEFSMEDQFLQVTSEISLFMLGSFGEVEEMPLDYREKSWMGLYLSDSLAILKPVNLKFEVEEMQDCGDDVFVRLAEDGPNPYFLISGLDSLSSGVPYASSKLYEPIDISHLEQEEITYSFNWGETQKVNEYVSEFVDVTWSVTQSSETDTLNQILYKTKNLPLDNHLNIDFMGDLDGDGIYDLIVDVATGYSYSINVLLLSSFAESNEILKPVAVFRTWGC